MSEERNVAPAGEETQELKRGIKGWQVAFIGLGGVIGSCYFLGLGICVHDMGPAVFIAFAVVGVIVYGLMIAYAELLVNLPRKGSFVAYTNEFLGPTISTGMGWAFWFNWVCYCPSEAIAVATVLQSLTGATSATSYVAFAVGALLALTIINLCAVDIFAKIESGLAITKVCVIILFIILAFGIWVGLWGSDGFLGATVNFGDAAVGFGSQLFPNGAAIVMTSMVVVLVTFQGTEIVGMQERYLSYRGTVYGSDSLAHPDLPICTGIRCSSVLCRYAQTLYFEWICFDHERYRTGCGLQLRQHRLLWNSSLYVRSFHRRSGTEVSQQAQQERQSEERSIVYTALHVDCVDHRSVFSVDRRAGKLVRQPAVHVRLYRNSGLGRHHCFPDTL